MFTHRSVSTTNRARSIGLCGIECPPGARAAQPNTSILKTLAYQTVEAAAVVDHLAAHVLSRRGR